jgi:hypothetical protein
MVVVGLGNNVVAVVPVGGSKASSNIKLVIQREPRYGKTWFLANSILPNEEPIDVASHDLFKEVGLTSTVDDLTLFSSNPIRVPLLAHKLSLNPFV